MNYKGLISGNYAKGWDTAFPIGNGTTGCLVFGNPLNEKIVTNNEELYVPMPNNNDSQPFYGAPYVEGLRKLLFEGKYYDATEYYFRGLAKEGHNYGEMIWTNPFETCTEIYIDMLISGDISDYERKLNFRNGECTVSYGIAGKKIERRAFVSRTRNVAVVSISADGQSFDTKISVGENEEVHNVNPVDISVEDGIIVSQSSHCEEESGYVSGLRIVTDGNRENIEEAGKLAGIKVSNATNVLLIYNLAPWKNRMEASKVKVLRLLNDTPSDYEVLLKEHSVIHKELFERVMVSFTKDYNALSIEQLKDLCTPEKLAPELMETMVDFGRYLLIASFGKLPPNLQGVWSGTSNPPWSADYTLDENIQMMMWQVLPGALPEFGRLYFDWLESYSEDFRRNAKAYYNCEGFFCAPRVSTDGNLRHFAHPWPMVFWTAGAGWLSSVYEDYYEYTGDKNILLRGVKYWKEVVRFYEDFLVEDEKGFYVFAPSYSPENTPLGNDSPTAINCTMDVAIAKEVYKNLINACKILDVEAENLEKWEKEYEKFPAYTVNEDGALKEWIPMELKDDYHHRHSSHLYPVFPGHEALENGNEELLKACHRAAQLRLIDGVDAISGWGLAHLANISARLKDDNLWYLALNRLVQVFTLDNLFTGHNPHSLFQMDANLGLTAAVFEAFVYSDMEKVELFPVNSEHFDYMMIQGLRAKGSVHIISLIKDKNIVTAEIENQGRSMMRIICPEGFSFENGDRELEIMPGERKCLKAIFRNS